MHRQVVGCEPHGQMVGCEPHGQMVGAVGAVGAVGCEPHGQMVGAVGAVGRVGIMGAVGAVGRGEKGKTLLEFGDFDKVYYFLKLIFNDISISLTPISKYYILILHSLLYCFLEKHSIVFRI